MSLHCLNNSTPHSSLTKNPGWLNEYPTPFQDTLGLVLPSSKSHPRAYFQLCSVAALVPALQGSKQPQKNIALKLTGPSGKPWLLPSKHQQAFVHPAAFFAGPMLTFCLVLPTAMVEASFPVPYMFSKCGSLSLWKTALFWNVFGNTTQLSKDSSVFRFGLRWRPT